MDLLSLLVVEVYKPSFKFGSVLLLQLAEAHLESLKWAASFDKEVTEDEVLSEMSNNGVLKAHLWHSL